MKHLKLFESFDGAKDASSIPLLNNKSTWEEIESYLKWLWNSPYQYHIDDDPESVDSFTPEEQKILRNNSDVMWGFNDRPENKDIDDKKMMNMLWDTYYVEDNEDVANEAAKALKDMSNAEKVAVYRQKISDERKKPAPSQEKIDGFNAKIKTIEEKGKKSEKK